MVAGTRQSNVCDFSFWPGNVAMVWTYLLSRLLDSRSHSCWSVWCVWVSGRVLARDCGLISASWGLLWVLFKHLLTPLSLSDRLCFSVFLSSSLCLLWSSGILHWLRRRPAHFAARCVPASTCHLRCARALSSPVTFSFSGNKPVIIRILNPFLHLQNYPVTPILKELKILIENSHIINF